MKLDVDVNEVVLSNVGTTGEFKIRNSAKAFKILSDGLYSNKIRAIIRELSCNAVDSHVGAGKADVPFEVHLPTILEPWFAVKDFGMGLDGDQVVNIYTTYFESTKTDSNAFIGALGLGSKSPFSYTENFTVTATKNGTQRIYSAFINEMGVPSIAEMSCQLTDEPNGVEVKFSVTDRNDYQSFRNEARNVFAWFTQKPVVVGVDSFDIPEIDYKEKNIVPGVHSRGNYDRYQMHSMALMGNIAYPLNNIPDPEKHFGKLADLLNCGLVFEFGIGDLDFAASREQLSYVPLTIASIKRKLEALNANLASHLAVKADAITGEWERAFFLYEEKNNRLYSAAVEKYVKDTKFPLYSSASNHYHGHMIFEHPVVSLMDRGLSINGFRARSGQSNKMSTNSQRITNPTTGAMEYAECWNIPVEKEVIIVLNDLKTGCMARARYHFNKHRTNATVYCVSHSALDMDERGIEYGKFLADLHNPPVVVKASDLDKQERVKPMSTQGIMQIITKSQRRSGYEDSYTWAPYHEALDDTKTYYYVTLSNHTPIDQNGKQINLFSLRAQMDECGVKDIADIVILGVRKNRIKELEDLDNWVWFEDKMKEETAKISDAHVASLVVSEMLDSYYNKVYTSGKVAKMVGPDSDYAKYFAKYGSIKRQSGNVTQLVSLCGLYGKAVQVDAVKKGIEDTKTELYRKYPLLKVLKTDSDTVTEKEAAEYIMMVDKLEKI